MTWFALSRGLLRRLARGSCMVGALAALVGGAQQGSAQDCIQDGSSTGTGVRVFPAARCGLDFTVSVPDSCADGGCGLILDVHGFAMDAGIQDRNTGLRELGRQNGFVVAQPTARVSGGQGLPSFAGAADADRIRAFAEEAIEAFRLDPAKIHIGGFSQGAGISFDFVCRNADLIASAAPIAGGGTNANCFQDGPPVPILQTNGTSDEFANFAAASRTRDSIVQGMGLQLSDGVVIASGPGITQTRFMNAEGEVYEFIQHEFVGASAGVGHCFPGSFERERIVQGPGLGNLRFACEDDASIRIGEAQIKFYIENPKR